jgi:hypothetical protein
VVKDYSQMNKHSAPSSDVVLCLVQFCRVKHQFQQPIYGYSNCSEYVVVDIDIDTKCYHKKNMIHLMWLVVL